LVRPVFRLTGALERQAMHFNGIFRVMAKPEDCIVAYGEAAFLRTWCPECRWWTFVIDGETVCCDTPYTSQPKVVKFTSSVEMKRPRKMKKVGGAWSKKWKRRR
jgi:hypothetical protein